MQATTAPARNWLLEALDRKNERSGPSNQQRLNPFGGVLGGLKCEDEGRWRRWGVASGLGWLGWVVNRPQLFSLKLTV